MGTKTPRPDTDPEMQRMIDRYVNNALTETGTAGAAAHGRLARASIPPPLDDFMAPPSVDPAAALVTQLAEAMAEAEIAEALAEAEIAALADTAYIRAHVPSSPAPVRVLFTPPPPKEFVDETPTDLDDDEPTGLFELPDR